MVEDWLGAFDFEASLDDQTGVGATPWDGLVSGGRSISGRIELPAGRVSGFPEIESLLRAGRFEDAAAKSGSLVAADPANHVVWRLLHLARAGRRDFAGALTAIERAVELDPDNLNYRKLRAVGLKDCGEDGRAVPLLEELFNASAPDPQICDALKVCCYRLGDLEKAVAFGALRLELLARASASAADRVSRPSPALACAAGSRLLLSVSARIWRGGKRELTSEPAPLISDNQALNQQRRAELQAEYLLLQNQYEAYDQRVLSLKALATPLLGAGVAFGIKQPSVVLISLTVAVAVALWLLETTWKVFQYCNIPRIQALEAWFASAEPVDLRPFQVYRSWAHAFQGEWRDVRRWWFIAREPFVYLPYVVVVVAGVIAVIALAFSPSSPGAHA
jgi:hypothetical protein